MPPLVSVCVDHEADLHDADRRGAGVRGEHSRERPGSALPPVRRPARGPVRRRRLSSEPRGPDPARRRPRPHRVRALRRLSRRATTPSSSAAWSAATPATAARSSTTAAATPRSAERRDTSRVSPLGTELLDDPGRRSGDGARVAPEHRAREPLVRRRRRRAVRAAPRARGVPRATAHAARPRHRPGRPAAARRRAGPRAAGCALRPVGSSAASRRRRWPAGAGALRRRLRGRAAVPATSRWTSCW